MHIEFAGRLGHSFHDSQLLQKALTHRSFYFENRATSPGHFERLEFLGDAVLDLVLSETLMKAFPQVDEGTLSKWRAMLVNEPTLAEVARELEIGKFLYLGKSEDGQRENLRPRLLSSAYEAVLGALYLDAGLEKSRAFIDRQFSSRLETLDMTNEFAADFKTRLQELTQSRFHCVPEYRMVSSEGPEHSKNFTYEVYVNDQRLGIGSGQSRKGAEQEAARDALSKEKQK
jgi:ribonuclease-3